MLTRCWEMIMTYSQPQMSIRRGWHRLAIAIVTMAGSPIVIVVQRLLPTIIHA